MVIDTTGFSHTLISPLIVPAIKNATDDAKATVSGIILFESKFVTNTHSHSIINNPAKTRKFKAYTALKTLKP